MQSALVREVPKWVFENLGRRVLLVNEVEGYRPGQRALLVAIESGIRSGPGVMKGSEPSWRGQAEPYVVLACDDGDLGDLANADFEDIRPIV